MNLNPKEVWWKHVPAARQMVKSAAKDLTDNVSSLQLSPQIAPWKEQFAEDLRECIDRYGYGIDLRDLRGDELSGYTTLLDGIVHVLGIDHGYDRTLSSIGQNLPTAGCILWLHDLSPMQEKQCFELCAMLSAVSGKNGFPRFRLIFEAETTTKRKGVRIINGGVPARSNIRYFVYRLLMEADLGKMTEYAVAVVMEKAGDSIERCGELCLEIITGSLSTIVESMSGDTNNFFAMHRAQIRTVEPLIQIGRLQLCQHYARQIQAILPYKDDYGKTIEDASELELRHLVYLKRDLRLTQEDDRRLRQLYDARNDLSHQRILGYQTVCELMEQYQ